MDHRSFWDLIRARWVTLVAFVLLGATAGSAYLLTNEPEYSAQAELFVAAVGSDNSSDDAQGSNYSQQQARIYSVFATREVVLGPVIEALELDTTPRELSRRVSATVPLNTSLISITVTDTSPDRAAATANAVATSVINTVVRVVPKRTDGTTPVRLETIQSASSPVVSAAFSPPIIIIGGLIGGLIAGLALVILREVVSTRVRSTAQVEQATGLAVLGSVVHDRAAVKTPLVPAASFGSPRFEEFRQLRTNLRLVKEDDARTTIVVTSSIPREGRSITAANLAIAFAASGHSVCLVEADLRRPSLAGYFDLDPSKGLTSVFAGTAKIDDVLHVWGSNGLTVVVAGPVPANPTELLESAAAIETLDDLANRFEFVIIDSPPVLPVADASILARAFGGALLVVGAGRTETRELRRATEALEAAGTAAFGVILNDVPTRSAGRYRNEYVVHADATITRPIAGTSDALREPLRGTPSISLDAGNQSAPDSEARNQNRRPSASAPSKSVPLTSSEIGEIVDGVPGRSGARP